MRYDYITAKALHRPACLQTTIECGDMSLTIGPSERDELESRFFVDFGPIVDKETFEKVIQHYRHIGELIRMEDNARV